MSLQFIFGAAGGGKSTYVQDLLIKESMQNPKINYFLIVPDQFTMQTQSDIVKRHPNKGIMNLDVLSFGRLTYRIFEETGGFSGAVLDDTGKSLVLRHVASSVSGDMPYIGPNLNKIGFIHEVKSSISEFMQYGISPEELKKISENADSGLLRHKLHDLCVIYDAFCKFNKDKFITNEETLDILCKRLEASEAIKDAVVVFDGFTGFTPIQENVIQTLLKLTKKVMITLTLSDSESPSEVDGEEKLFYLSRKTAGRLKKQSRDNDIAIDGDLVLSDVTHSRYAGHDEFVHLEKNLFRFPYDAYKKNPTAIRMFRAEHIQTEVDEVCRQIYEMIKDKGYAYRDFAVVVGSLESYADLFERRFTSLGMPYFIDQTSKVVLNPFVEYLKSAMRVVINDYSYDSVMHFLRSGFTDISQEEVDAFDLYVSGLNIRGKSAYHRKFTRIQRNMPRDRAELATPPRDETRKKIIGILSVIEKSAKTAGDHVNNLYALIKNNNSFEKLQTYEEKFANDGNHVKAKEYSQMYRLIIDLLDVIMELVGDEEMSLDEFYKIFEAGILELKVGTIPANVDRIVVGDIERTRLNEVKALFFVGVNDGNIPGKNDKGGLLSNLEREKLSDKGIELSPTFKTLMNTQKLYLYMNLLKPREYLSISYSAGDRSGNAMQPSYLCDTMTRLFPELKVVDVSQKSDLDSLTTVKESYADYADLVRRHANGILDETSMKLMRVLSKYYEDLSDEKTSQMIEDAAFYRYVSKPLAKEVAALIYGTAVEFSISRMEKYAGCAYAHFLSYGMKLKELDDYSFSKQDLGTIYHDVLKLFSEKLISKGLSFMSVDRKIALKLVEECVYEYVQDYEQGLLTESEESNYRVQKIVEVMQRTVDTLLFQIRRGEFVPTRFEKNFSRKLDLNNGEDTIKINGRIDRIDLYEKDGKVYVKIIDYKSSFKDLDVTKIYYGIQQQLPVYMMEAIAFEKQNFKGRQVLPAGMFYYTSDNPILDGVSYEATDDEIANEIRKKLRLHGYVENEMLNEMDRDMDGGSMVLAVSDRSKSSVVNSSQMQSMIDYVGRMVERIGENVLNGDINVNPMRGEPTDACKYCSYHEVCGFDDRLSGYKARKGDDITANEAKEIVFGGINGKDYVFR